MLRKVPHTYVIIFAIIVIAAVMTWFIPAGSFDRTGKTMPDGTVRQVIVQDSFHRVEQAPQTWQVFSAMFKGFVNQSEIIIFILMIGGAFWIMNASKALDVGIMAFIRTTGRLEKYRFLRKLGVNNIVMVLIMLMFSLFGAIFGMSEETIAFVIILVPLAISMGYDSITGVCLVYVSAHLGFAGAMLNPFTIGIAQGLSDIPIFSGIEYRIICWLLINAVGFSFILVYANRIKRKPERSLTHKIDEFWRNRKIEGEQHISYYTPKIAWVVYAILVLVLAAFAWFYPSTSLHIGNNNITGPVLPVICGLFALTAFFSLRKSVHYFNLNLLAYTIVFLIVGVMGYQWYVMEIGTLFLAMGLSAGISINMSANNLVKQFLEGAKDIFSAALVVGLAGGIIVILTDGYIVDSIMYGLSKTMQGFGKLGSLSTMYGIQTALNIIIPSGSAKAALTMPIMAPFSDLIGVSRQATVMAFQFGDGFTNMITPTSGVLIGVLGVAKIPYDIWFRWVWKLILALFILGLIMLIPTVYLSMNGF